MCGGQPLGELMVGCRLKKGALSERLQTSRHFFEIGPPSLPGQGGGRANVGGLRALILTRWSGDSGRRVLARVILSWR